MKKNGFIATSLLYSFFLVFCALLLALVGTLMHNQVLLTNYTENIKNDLSEVGKKTLSSVKVGSYVKIPLFSYQWTLNTENIKWIVASSDSSTVTLVSDNILLTSNKHNDKNVLQEDMNSFFNLYTTGPESASINYITYLTKNDIDEFEYISDLTVRKALLAANIEYFYYDDNDSRFYLYEYECDSEDRCNANSSQISTDDEDYYGLRFVMKVSSATPISSGTGTLNDSYEVLYYIHKNETGNILKLHYDNINSSGNLGFQSNSNYFTDLSGNNLKGEISDVNLINTIDNGATIPHGDSFYNIIYTINTNLKIPGEYTIEFRANNYVQFSFGVPNSTNYIRLKDSALTHRRTIYFNGTGYMTNAGDIGLFKTFSIVKKPGLLYDVYIDGVLFQSNITVSFASIIIDNNMYIGADTINDAIIKSVRVYNKALTEAEIIHNYNVDKRWRIT